MCIDKPGVESHWEIFPPVGERGTDTFLERSQMLAKLGRAQISTYTSLL